MSDTRYFGAIEAGGTKFVCAIGDADGNILAEQRFPTSDPHATLGAAHTFLRERAREFAPFASIGVASFGPVELDQSSPKYGFITGTPKPGWRDTDIIGGIKREFGCPVGFDTDVTAAAFAEHRWGTCRDVADLVYVTVGTGIGGGALINGAPLHGLMHPEIGHIYPRRHPLDTFAGLCPYHGDCIEGLASGPAIVARSGHLLAEIDASHPQWEIEADYLGQLCAHVALVLSPRRIVMGGGVMAQERLLPLIRKRARHWLCGYIDHAQITTGCDRYIVAPALGARAGVLGALALALDAAPER